MQCHTDTKQNKKKTLINQVLVDYCHQQTGPQSFLPSVQQTLSKGEGITFKICSGDNPPLCVRLPESTTLETASLQPSHMTQFFRC